MAKVDTRTLAPAELESLRRRAVDLVIHGGMSQAEAAREVGASEQSLSSWMKRYRSGGEDALVDKPRGSARQVLTKRQESTIRRLIVEKNPDQLRLPFALWTTDAIRELIKIRYDKEISKSSVYRLLRSWGFTPKKSSRRAWQQDSEAVRHWMIQEYPSIARRAKRQKGRIFWGDETGLRSDESLGFGWGPIGERVIASATGHRFTCNVVSAIDNEGALSFNVFKGGFKIATFIKFLGQLIRHAKGRKVFLIVDRHPVHRSKAVVKWIKERTDQIELHFLPSYSPELNPDEYLNHDLKAQTVRKHPVRAQDHMMAMARGHLRRRQRQPAKVAAFFRAPFVQYAA